MNNILLTHDPLDISEIYNSARDPACGAISLFVGTTRDNFEGKSVLQLEYEAYESMAVKSLETLANELRHKYSVANVAIHHRLGVVPVSDASVVIAVSSAHRQASLEAVSYAIDALKASVPIFKKEVYGEDGGSQWKQNPEFETYGDEQGIEFLEVVSSSENNYHAGSEVSSSGSELVQVTASADEINRRIASFIKHKREELNRINLQDFCFHGAPIIEREYSCARVDAVLIRRKDSKSHLKVCRVENLVGPQVTEQLPTQDADYTDYSTELGPQCPAGAEERIQNAERYLGLQNAQTDVFTRLKAVEDRILFLESVSPEYFNVAKPVGSMGVPDIKKVTAGELRQKIVQLEMKLQSKCGSTSTSETSSSCG